MKDTMGSELIVGNEVIVSGKHDGEEFNCNVGVIIRQDGTVLIRFDDWSKGHGEGSKEWHFHDSDREGWTITQHGQRSVGPSTYLNGLEDSITFEPRYEWSEDPVERARPRFMTAYLVPDDRVFVPTGDAFMTKEAADAAALEMLKENEIADQIGVLELRSVHMARLTITSEAA